MKKIYIIILTIGISATVVYLWKINQKESTTEEIYSVESEENQPKEPSVIWIEQIKLAKVVSTPKDTEFLEPSSDRLVNFRVAGDKILKGNQVLWSEKEEYISFVQESPDGNKIIFFKQNEGKYVIYRHDNGDLKKLDIKIPSRIHGSREDGWYWAGNDHLINEQIEDFEPSPRGYENEGWIKGNKIYVFNLRSNTIKEMMLDQLSHPKENDILLTDELDPNYAYKIPVLRYYRIKGITRDGVIALKSVDTSEPLGGNPRDEGAFRVE